MIGLRVSAPVFPDSSLSFPLSLLPPPLLQWLHLPSCCPVIWIPSLAWTCSHLLLNPLRFKLRTSFHSQIWAHWGIRVPATLMDDFLLLVMVWAKPLWSTRQYTRAPLWYVHWSPPSRPTTSPQSVRSPNPLLSHRRLRMGTLRMLARVSFTKNT